MRRRMGGRKRFDSHAPYDLDGYAAVRGNDLIFSGDVDDRMFAFLWDCLLRSGTRLDNESEAGKGKEKRRLFLNSLGGCCYSMLSIVDLFEEVADLTTVATGACMSAAVPIIAAGTVGQRFATHRTRFMIHPAWELYDQRMEKDDLKVETKEMEVLEEAYADVMARYCNKDHKWWKTRLSKNKTWYFGADEAKELGIIDTVFADRLH